MTINYNNKDIELKFSFRADMLFENINGRSFLGQTITDWMTYFFCTVLAITRDDDMQFDDFVDWLSDRQYLLTDFVKWYTDVQTTAQKLQRDVKSDDSKKKTTAKKKKA